MRYVQVRRVGEETYTVQAVRKRQQGKMLQRTQMKEKNMQRHEKGRTKKRMRMAQGEEMQAQMLDKDEAIKA